MNSLNNDLNRKRISISWLFILTLTVAATLGACELTKNYYPIHYTGLIAWSEVLFVIGSMFLISIAPKLPLLFVAKRTGSLENLSWESEEWSLLMGIWLTLPLLAVWTEQIAGLSTPAG